MMSTAGNAQTVEKARIVTARQFTTVPRPDYIS
jgi:hypothetical protein